MASSNGRHLAAVAAAEPPMTLAAAHIELAVRLAEVCTRPARWRGVHDTGGPATNAFFLISAASADWVEAAAAHPRVRVVDVSLEAMGSFAAIEASIATGRPQLIIAGSGPGTFGHLWALAAARAQGATALVLVPRTAPARTGAHDIQESSFGRLAAAGVFDETIALDDVAQMPRIAMRLRQLFARPQGAIVALGVPTSLLREDCPALPDVGAVEVALPAPSERALAWTAAALSRPGGPPAFLLGSGCLPFRERLPELVARWGAVHFTTPAATGILPGSLGVVGNGAYGDVARELRERDVRCVVVLGTRLGIASGGGDADLLPDGCPVVHVDVDPVGVVANADAVIGRPVLSVTADIGEFLDALRRIAPAPAPRLQTVRAPARHRRDAGHRPTGDTTTPHPKGAT